MRFLKTLIRTLVAKSLGLTEYQLRILPAVIKAVETEAVLCPTTITATELAALKSYDAPAYTGIVRIRRA